jgi:hypothetical protein
LHQVDRRRRGGRDGLRSAGAALVWLAAGLAGSLPVSAAAEEMSSPLEFEVRPSGVLAEIPAETPDEALDRRLRQREYLFRSICKQCSRGDRFSSDVPFKPLDALAGPARN